MRQPKRQEPVGEQPDQRRRKVLGAALAAGGSLVAASMLPGRWTRPLALIGATPAHAQISEAPLVAVGLFLEDPLPLAPPGAGAQADTLYGVAELAFKDALAAVDGDTLVSLYLDPDGSSTDRIWILVDVRLGDLPEWQVKWYTPPEGKVVFTFPAQSSLCGDLGEFGARLRDGARATGYVTAWVEHIVCPG